MNRIKTSERLPNKTGEYHAYYNGNEKCLMSFSGGKITKLKFSNNAQMTDDFRDFSKEPIEWIDESASSPTTEEGVRSDNWDVELENRLCRMYDLWVIERRQTFREAVVETLKEYASQFRSSGIITPSSDANKVHNTGDK